MITLDKSTFVEMVKSTKKHFDIGIEDEYRLAELLGAEPEKIIHPLVTFSMFIADTLETMFDDQIIGDWIYENIVLDEKGGFETWVTSNCGKEKSFYIKDEADLYDYLEWKARQKDHTDCCGKTED